MPAARSLLIVASCLLFGPGLIAGRGAAEIVSFGAGKHRGICYAHSLRHGKGYGSDDSARALQHLADLGVSWISITPFAFQRSPRDAALRWDPNRFSENDESLRAAAAQAHALRIRVMLKPHVWLRPPDWPGSIDPGSEEGWSAWFESYREFILHYARLAQSAGMDSLCIGNELEKSTAHANAWREIVRSVRSAYRGPITYGATTEEAERVAFWDALDFIGLSAYYPLVQARTPSREALEAAWEPQRARLAALSKHWNRRVVFTEIGYRSADFGAWRQWELGRNAPVNLEAQAAAYEAFFARIWPEPWFGGAYWWKWFSHPDAGEAENEFEPKNKPAERVIARHYLTSAGRP
jgi:hypothetical protein